MKIYSYKKVHTPTPSGCGVLSVGSRIQTCLKTGVRAVVPAERGAHGLVVIVGSMSGVDDVCSAQAVRDASIAAFERFLFMGKPSAGREPIGVLDARVERVNAVLRRLGASAQEACAVITVVKTRMLGRQTKLDAMRVLVKSEELKMMNLSCIHHSDWTREQRVKSMNRRTGIRQLDQVQVRVFNQQAMGRSMRHAASGAGRQMPGRRWKNRWGKVGPRT